MQQDICKTDICSGIKGLYIKTAKFKTRRITLSFILDTNKKSAACASLLARLLVSASKKFPDIIELNKALNSLYGTKLNGYILRAGDVQLLNISINTLCDRFALENENISEQAIELLKEVVFNPKAENGAFDKENFECEKRLLIEDIQNRINDKRRYAISRLIEKMCEDEPFGVPDAGGDKAVEELSPEEVFEFWQHMLKTAPVNITVVGEEQPDDVYNSVRECFSSVKREVGGVLPQLPAKYKNDVTEFSENMSITQGKLVMGFTTMQSSILSDVAGVRVMTDIFGGAPYSFLFTVVREKMSLCYYCAARFYSIKGVLCVDSGIEMENFEKSKTGIIEQLERLKKGDFEDSLLQASKIGISDSVRGVYDTSASIENWYLSRMFDSEILSPAEYIESINKVTKEQVIAAAQCVKLDTVFFLKGKD